MTGDGDGERPESIGDDRTPRTVRPIKLLQGYVWHPRELEIDLGDFLPSRLDPDVHVLWDVMPSAPFTFFDDGTLAATQRVYQFTVMRFVPPEEEPGALLPWLAETLQASLETTPEGVGWQVMDDLREVG
ncbi:DUF3208 domain-containing protein [soil metagenome]